MTKYSSPALLLILSIFITSFGQTPAKEASQPQAEQDEVVRITTNLVQIDVVVTDKKGQLVTDLTAEDFEVYENGRRQEISNLSFISTATDAPQQRPATANGKTATAPLPPVRLQPEQVRRTIALVVDDLCLSFSSISYVRRALRKFVDEQMQPGDLVAIIRTAGSVSVLQQFTSDKRQLYAAVEQVKWYPTGCNHSEAFEQLNESLQLPGVGINPENGSDRIGAMKETGGMNSTGSADVSGFRQDTLTVGSLGALSYIVRGLKELPGRKSILFISDGFSLVDRNSKDDPNNRRVMEAIDRVTDLASRSSVVIYTLDARGLVTTNFTAADSMPGSKITGTSGEAPYNNAAEVLTARSAELNDTQAGLIYLARQTGGFPVVNTNDLAGGIRRVMEDQRGYYLIGYRPEESTFDPRTGRRRFNKFTVKVKRPGLSVRTRTGFYGVSEETIATTSNLTRGQQLVKALVSPFSTNGVQLRLTSLFGNDTRTGSYMRSLLYIDASDLTFKPEADGWYQTVMDVMAVTFGDRGQVVDEVNRTQTIRVRGKTYENVLKNGLVYFMNLPVKKAGVYQLRIAVRDAATEQVGSASQFIEVPDLKKKQVMTSGLVLTGYDPAAQQRGSAGSPPEAANARQQAVSQAEGAQEELDPQASAAVRRFRQGMIMNYGFVIYNAQLDKSTRQPQLTTQLRLFRDGKLVFTGKPQAVDLKTQADMGRLVAGGALRLGAELVPGEYVLQVVVTDFLAKDDKRRTATQWIDFEIVK